MREATVEDAPFLAELWREYLRHAEPDEQVADVRTIILRASASPDERLFIAECEGHPAGAVLGIATTYSPVNLDRTLHVFSPVVLGAYRRKGIGHALIEAVVGFAEELGIGHIAMPAASSSRDANRFLARLALAPAATWRAAATATVRGKLTTQLPPAQRIHERRIQLGQVLAARRSMRHQQSELLG